MTSNFPVNLVVCIFTVHMRDSLQALQILLTILFVFFSDMVCSVAGITSDANVLTNELRLIGQRYLLEYGESIPCEQLVSWLCDVKQAYTQYGGNTKREFSFTFTINS